MVFDFIRRNLPPDNVPNRFTEAVGDLIKFARNEANLTQKELSELAYIPQSTLSKMENGKVEPSASELVYLSGILNKPILYFFPKNILRQLKFEEQDDEILNELLLVGSKLKEIELRKVIAQIRAIIDLNESGN